MITNKLIISGIYSFLDINNEPQYVILVEEKNNILTFFQITNFKMNTREKIIELLEKNLFGFFFQLNLNRQEDLKIFNESISGYMGIVSNSIQEKLLKKLHKYK